MDRKKFLSKLGLGLLASGSLATTACNRENVPAAEDCELTGSDILGPFFVENSPNIVNLNTQNLPGTPMMVSGKIYGGPGQDTPLANVKIEVWHADNGGAYHPEGNGDISNYDSSEVTLRGFVLSDSDGNYAFSSIVPGLYGSRARHIHFKLTADGYTDLVTQTYFEGDNRIAMDGSASEAGDCRIVTFSDDGNGTQAGIMDFNLQAR